MCHQIFFVSNENSVLEQDSLQQIDLEMKKNF